MTQEQFPAGFAQPGGRICGQSPTAPVWESGTEQTPAQERSKHQQLLKSSHISPASPTWAILSHPSCWRIDPRLIQSIGSDTHHFLFPLPRQQQARCKKKPHFFLFLNLSQCHKHLQFLQEFYLAQLSVSAISCTSLLCPSQAQSIKVQEPFAYL